MVLKYNYTKIELSNLVVTVYIYLLTQFYCAAKNNYSDITLCVADVSQMCRAHRYLLIDYKSIACNMVKDGERIIFISGMD